MPRFSVNSYRFDPYRNFKFKVKWDNEYVAGLSKCSALKKSTEVVEFREGGDPSHNRKMPGMTKYEPITLEAGVTHDAAFEEWANLVNNFAGDAAMSLKDFRKDQIVLDVFNLQGIKVFSYIIHRCWVSEYQALPELDASGNAVMIRTLTLQNEGWERDTSVTEPSET
ncbi:phage tail protein [Halomonas ramblicola]|uniref:phage tail protein n=1 Tax=Halomonas ramblicola TaxID=747349 RepID=UPI0025B30926|nr:phage tail protein [Halomonas ramblicola]MDN3522564.1 phage tail protein [Halomonas ramblicola]